jgi:hypothetical protein
MAIPLPGEKAQAEDLDLHGFDLKTPLSKILDDAGISEAVTAKLVAAKVITLGDLDKKLGTPINQGPGEPARWWRVVDAGLSEAQARKVLDAIVEARKGVKA